ncbi:hyaluronan and proteoglycan link protein 1a isoform X1 [Pangasianodon hypophthalmus]|uniref:hyaluronan and proteoglycan link protein 1a isoform X1 n=1 Tax=Pangasianodon hypophthalmus TaxID=310915 RepID=UPI000EFEA6A1|nr:hyaluronan and proteoglycan link protein 1a isoform X1 [Pangasianodon hypophthalmus]
MITIIPLALVWLSLANNAYTAESRLQIFANPGENVSLPCQLNRSDGFTFGGIGNRIKWTKLEDDNSETDVLLSMGFHKITHGRFQNHAHLQEADENDATLIITNLDLDDFGTYKCELISGMDDITVEMELRMGGEASLSFAGVVFPYSPRFGRYNLNFHDAEAACLGQDAVVASFEQLYKAWKGGMDWCNAGWLRDGTVQYPITKPRQPCGGNAAPGLRSYGRRNKTTNRFDVFCYTTGYNGNVFFVDQKLTFLEAVQACEDDGAELAKVGHMFAAWKLQGYDRCDAGWLADGSVRYPISKPRMKCSPTEAAVRSVGFPEKKHKLYGAYCFRAHQ